LCARSGSNERLARAVIHWQHAIHSSGAIRLKDAIHSRRGKQMDARRRCVERFAIRWRIVLACSQRPACGSGREVRVG
jgi:hypothetical protein